MGRKISCTEILQPIVKQKGVNTEGLEVAVLDQLSPKGLWSEPVTRRYSR